MQSTNDGLRCQVSDSGPASGQPWPVRQGHGLWIVRKAVDKVTVQSGPAGSLVAVVFGPATA
jgi:hypothetical protein